MRRTALLAVAMVAALAIFSAAAGATNGKVLIVEDTVVGGAYSVGTEPPASVEAYGASLAGKGVVAVNVAQLLAMSTADVAQYDAVVLGDAKCATSLSASGITSLLGTPANPAKWAPAITGNVIVLGTDPVKSFFEGNGGMSPFPIYVIQGSIAFAAAGTGTGAYIDLSCYYASATSPTHVDVLDQFGSFSVRGAPCTSSATAEAPASAHVVATHPAFEAPGWYDTTFSQWWVCSARETFDTFPTDFTPVAILNDPAGGPLPGSLSFADGSHGPAYIVARGSGLVPVSVTPPANTAPVANDDAYQTAQAVALTMSVLDNDTDVDLNPLTAAQVAAPSHGSLALSADHRSFTYTPDAHFAGTDTFTYTANDGTLDSNVATVTITVHDTELPAITCPANVTTAVGTGQTSAVVNYTVTATDNAPGVTTSSSPASGSAFPVGTTTVTATATDAANNVSSCSFTVTVTLRPTTLAYTGPSTATLGSPTLTARLTDTALASGLAGKQVTFAVDGGAQQTATTSSTGVASFTPSVPLTLGSHSIVVRFAGDGTNAASTATGTIAIAIANTTGGGAVSGDDLKPATGGSADFDVKLKVDRGQRGNADIDGHFRYVNKSNKLESKRITALTIAADRKSAWFSGVARDGRTFVVYVESGKASSAVLKLWIDGVLQTGTGALRAGSIRITS
jgi:hypothetical protein